MVWNLIASGFSALVSGVVKVASSIGPAIARSCECVLPVLEMALKIGKAVLEKTLDVVEKVMKVLDILETNEKMEDIGDRAIQAREKDIVPEKFETYEAYMEAIRNFSLDPDQSAKTSSEEKRIIGMAVSGRAMEEKFSMAEGASADIVKLVVTSSDFFSPDRVRHMVETGTRFSDVVSYLKGDLSPTHAKEVKSELFQTEKKMDPQANEETFYETLHDIADNNPLAGR